MSEKIMKEYRRSTHLMETIRRIVARGHIHEYPSVFYGYIKDVEECMANIAHEMEKQYADENE